MPDNVPGHETLRREAELLVARLGLLEILGRYGRSEVVGSVALDLMVKRDIDVHVLIGTTRCRNVGLTAVVSDLWPRLLGLQGVGELRLTDYRDVGAIKIGIDHYPGPTGDWSIDLWLTDREETTGFATVRELRAALTPETREAVLTIKRHYHRLGQLRDGLSSRIYEAVTRQGARTVEDFERRQKGS
ncbi:MAG: hypothetical protein ACYC9Q_07580 [Bacillota bacterium]